MDVMSTNQSKVQIHSYQHYTTIYDRFKIYMKTIEKYAIDGCMKSNIDTFIKLIATD